MPIHHLTEAGFMPERCVLRLGEIVRYRFFLSVAAITVLGALATAAADDRRSEQISVSDLAEGLIDACFEYASEQHLPPLSMALVDDGGALVSFRRQAGAPALIGDAAILKAQSAARTHEATAQLLEESQDPSIRDAYSVLRLTTLPGGVPLTRGDVFQGAVGVSGAETAQDAQCAKRALEAYSRDSFRYVGKSQDNESEIMVRRRLAEFERDFNGGAVAALMAQYDMNFVGILGSEILDYAAYTSHLKETLKTRPRFKLDIHQVRLLGKTRVLANGFADTIYVGRTQKELFTVIYGQFGSVWKLVYAHSSSL